MTIAGSAGFSDDVSGRLGRCRPEDCANVEVQKDKVMEMARKVENFLFMISPYVPKGLFESGSDSYGELTQRNTCSIVGSEDQPLDEAADTYTTFVC